jgi:ubiquinone biosynthesis UbiH/UbiF/VisC/COQ6 family hydroxylase
MELNAAALPQATTASPSADVIIVGAGPAGMSLALSLARLGLRITLLERLDERAVAEPQDDGREIALTHESMRILDRLGVCSGWTGAEMSPIREAHVYNGRSPRFLGFGADAAAGVEPLGWLVANHRIRRELHRRLREQHAIRLLCGRQVVECRTEAQQAAVRTAADGWIHAPLLIAADSRFSELRRAMGIGAQMRDFGSSMLVVRAEHDRPHRNVAMEWFDYGHTIAALPLHGQVSSLILTLPGAEAERLGAAPAQLQQRLNRWLQGRLGEVRLCSPAHRYPLIGVYAHRFAGRRFALAGDAAVGMHPVTAHGFNFGLSGQQLLASAIASQLESGGDIAAEAALVRYEREHRRRTWPLFQATNAIAALYSSDSALARLGRSALLGLSRNLDPLRRAIAAELRA